MERIKVAKLKTPSTIWDAGAPQKGASQRQSSQEEIETHHLAHCNTATRKGLIKIHFLGWCFSHQHLITAGFWPALNQVSYSRGQKQITRLFEKQNAQQINFLQLQSVIITQARRGSNLISVCDQNQTTRIDGCISHSITMRRAFRLTSESLPRK